MRYLRICNVKGIGELFSVYRCDKSASSYLIMSNERMIISTYKYLISTFNFYNVVKILV